jgi:di/tripeptidase
MPKRTKLERVPSEAFANIFAGGLNFHGKFEWVTVENIEKAAAVIRNLVSLYAE